MLLSLTNYSPFTLDPTQYRTTLVVALDTSNGFEARKPMCGVFAGRHDPFEKHEEGMLVPIIEEDSGRTLFLLDRPSARANLHEVLRWHYTAIGWFDDIHTAGPSSFELTLSEAHYDEEHHDWTFSWGTRYTMATVIVLDDYQPGAMNRRSQIGF